MPYIDLAVVPVLLAVSLTPGLCMMLALTLGAAIGVRRTLWMMIGELSGVGLVAILAMTSIATMMLAQPDLYRIGKVAGGVYLIYIGLQIARTEIGALSPVAEMGGKYAGAGRLIWQGFFAAVSNPKSWLLYASLLPPFLQPDRRLLPQVASLVSLLLLVEFTSLLLYAGCGQAARHLLRSPVLARSFFIIAGTVILAFGVEVMVWPD